jgi:cell division protease FtsH
MGMASKAIKQEVSVLNNFYRNLSLWIVIGLVVILLYNLFSVRPQPVTELVYSDFLSRVVTGEVQEVLIKGRTLSGTFTDGTAFATYSADDPELVSFLREQDIQITAEPSQDSPWYVTVFVSWFPMLLLIAVWIFFMRQMQAGGSKAMSFGKSKARLLTDSSVKVTFNDVAGVDEAKEELEEIIDFLKDPQRFQKLGGKIPKGVLLMGPPGTGKTLLAKAVAGEADCPFFSISGSDFVEMFVGVGASRVRDLFEQGKKHAPCIIFIDEIDAVGRHRGAGLGGGHDEREQTLNALLVEMDGFESNEGVILIAATNRPDVLDPALTRPGRFDRQVIVLNPDIKGREGILLVHTKNIPVGDDVELEIVARGTPGFSGADLANLVNEAALLAARRDRTHVAMEDFEEAKDKVLMGTERRSMIISDAEKKTTAYHEAGHTLVAKMIPGADPIHKVTIIPRGRALGLTQQLPIDEKHTYPKGYLCDRLAILLGGRIAEELVFDTLTTGAGNDIERGTEMARKMVCEWGMSEEMGPLTFGKKEEQIFLGREISQHRDYSESTAIKIDDEVKKLVMDAYAVATGIVSGNLDALHRLASALLEHEVLDGVEIDTVIKGGKLPDPVEPEVEVPPSDQSADAPAETSEEPPETAPEQSDTEQDAPTEDN